MDKNKKVAIIYYITSVICYLCSIVWFGSSSAGFGTMWLCIGSANFCLGSVYLKRSKKKEAENDDTDAQINEKED